MNGIIGEFWQNHGTSIIWDSAVLEAAASRGVTVSLRMALSWIGNMPVEPPNGSQTVVITGLQTALEAISTEEIEPLCRRVGDLVREHSRKWPEAALVFAARSPERFEDLTPSGAIRLRLATGTDIDIADVLWDGTKAEARSVIVSVPDVQGRETTKPAGWWLRRVS